MENLAPDGVLLHYRLVARLGRGGMGEVWRAVDTRLNREIAIKVLPEAVANDPERLARLEREAIAMARLSHPNIVTVHAVEEANGIRFVAMELVRGKTLADLLPRGGLPLDRFLGLAVPLVDAVAAAHRGGVTHRDIKPSNVMVTDDGLVKVLDFGLAKLTLGSGEDLAHTQLTTETVAPQAQIVGTVAYMSPEQAQGKPVDHRSDVFSLGVVLYEMLTGSRPFTGDTLVSLLSSIVKDTPSSVTELRRDLPPGAGRIVRRCLAKDPERRYQTAIDLRNDLEELRDESSSGVAATLPRARRPGLRRWGGIAVAAAAVAVLVAAYLLVAIIRAGGSPPGAASTSPSGLSIVPLTRSGTAVDTAISPDGRYAVYVASEKGAASLRVKQLATGSDREILPPGTARLFGPKVSPDGAWVYYVMREEAGAIYRLPLLGGHPQKVLEDVAGDFALSPDGERIAFYREHGQKVALIVAAIDGSGERQLLEHPTTDFDVLAWSSQGGGIYFTDRPPSKGLGSVVREVMVDGGAVRDLGDRVWQMFGMATLPAGRGLLVAGHPGGTTFQLPPQIWRFSPDGAAVRLTHDVESYQSLSLDRSGERLAAVQWTSDRSILILPGGDERHARQVAYTSRAGPYWCGVAWTPDGRLLYEDLEGESLQIWIGNPDGTGAEKLTRAGQFNMGATVSPDGTTVAYVSDRSGRLQVWLSDLDGGNAHRLTNDPMVETFPRFSADGRWIVYDEVRDDGSAAIRKAPTAGGPSLPVIDYTSFMPVVSHDGRRLAFASDDPDGHWGITVTDFATGETVAHFAQDLVGLPFVQWTPDDRGVAAVGRTGAAFNIVVHPLDGSPARQITHFGDGSVLGFAWSQDGSSLALVRAKDSSDVVLITGFAPQGE